MLELPRRCRFVVLCTKVEGFRARKETSKLYRLERCSLPGRSHYAILHNFQIRDRFLYALAISLSGRIIAGGDRGIPHNIAFGAGAFSRTTLVLAFIATVIHSLAYFGSACWQISKLRVCTRTRPAPPCSNGRSR